MDDLLRPVATATTTLDSKHEQQAGSTYMADWLSMNIREQLAHVFPFSQNVAAGRYKMKDWSLDVRVSDFRLAYILRIGNLVREFDSLEETIQFLEK